MHGGIDGFSRIPVFLRCATNNRAETVKDSFVQAVQEFGLPLRVRCDKGGENVDVAQFMWSLPNRSQEFGSILMGKSVHNQRIERLWKDVFSGCLFLYYQLFNYLEDCMLLDPCNEVQLFALHYIFLPRIQDSLDHFRQAYIQHPISSARNQTPAQLWTAGLIRGIEDNRRWADELYQVFMIKLIVVYFVHVHQLINIYTPFSPMMQLEYNNMGAFMHVSMYFHLVPTFPYRYNYWAIPGGLLIIT